MDWSGEARAIAAKMPDGEEAWLPLWIHAADTAGAMLRLFDSWLNEAGRRAIADGLETQEARRLCKWVALMHDLGKCTPAFQYRISQKRPALREALEGFGLSLPKNIANIACSPHALAGAALLLREHENDSLAAVVGAHHGKPWASRRDVEVQLESYSNNYYGCTRAKAAWSHVQNEFLAAARRACGYARGQSLPELSLTAQMLLSGLLIMADWIASNTDYFPLLPFGEDDVDVDARLRTAWERLDLPPSWEAEAADDPGRLCQKRFGFAPNAVQRGAIDAVLGSGEMGMLIVEAPMGAGKTEAALLAAELLSARGAHRGGIFFGLPTQATADGIFDRVERWGESQVAGNRATIRLAHGMAALNEAYAGLRERGKGSDVDADGDGGVFAHAWMQGRKRALLSDFVVGTVDQALMAALCQKHVMLRHLGLCGKVVVIDECHAYDTYMNCYLDRMLNWLGAYRVPVVMLSATLPYARRTGLIGAYLGRAPEQGAWQKRTAYPLLTWTDGRELRQREIPLPSASQTVRIERLRAAESADEEAALLAERLREALADGGCAAVVLNTVRRAQRFAQILMERLPEREVMLLHAQFLAEDRKERERALLRRVGKRSERAERDGLIVVGTQVIEQSLDIDLDLLISDLCPMDLLLQRIGRLHRHRRHDAMRPECLRAPRCLVLGADGALEGGARRVYGEYLLMRTRALLPDALHLPEDISPLVQAVYDKAHPLPEAPEGYDGAREKEALKQAKMEREAQTFLLESPVDTLAETIGEMMETAVPPDDAHARAAVRSGDPGLEVLMLAQDADGDIRRVPWRVGGERWRAEEKPDEADCRSIAAQRIRLPGALSASRELWEDLQLRQRELEAWRASPWLRTELILLLDGELRAELGGYKLRYAREWGFLLAKEEV